MLLSESFERALLYAHRLHAAQVRKGGDTPYISHLLSVCGLVLEHGGDETISIAALLHDAIEDQGRDGQTRQEILDQFGPEVCAIVEGCTDATTHPKPPWRARKEAYLAHLPQASRPVLLVSVCDKLANVRSILADHRQVAGAVWSRFSGGKAGTLWYYRALAEIYSQVLPSAVTQEFVAAVADLEHRAQAEAQQS